MKPNGISLENYDVPLLSVPANWKDLAPFPPNRDASTYSFQDKLPHLPVPSLPDTLNKLKKSLQAMATSDAEYEATVRKIDAFGQKVAIGETLHSRLEQRARDVEARGGRQHWLDEWWDEVAYMGYRDSASHSAPYPFMLDTNFIYGNRL
jgi:carnitine O-acetyltransferase